MFRVITCLSGQHDLRLVALAIFVCFLASFVGINLFGRANDTGGRARLAWLALAGAAAGCGIWATHFIAMLAYEPGIPVAYDVVLTALSLFLAMLITACGLSLAVFKREGCYPAIGGIIIGGGVACMHYTGMLALEVPGHIFWAPDLVATSIVLGMVLGAASLMVAVRYEGKRGTLLSAVLFTLAIVSHHFTAMGAVEIAPDPLSTIHPFALSPSTLALAV